MSNCAPGLSDEATGLRLRSNQNKFFPRGTYYSNRMSSNSSPALPIKFLGHLIYCPTSSHILQLLGSPILHCSFDTLLSRDAHSVKGRRFFRSPAMNGSDTIGCHIVETHHLIAKGLLPFLIFLSFNNLSVPTKLQSYALSCCSKLSTTACCVTIMISPFQPYVD